MPGHTHMHTKTHTHLICFKSVLWDIITHWHVLCSFSGTSFRVSVNCKLKHKVIGDHGGFLAALSVLRQVRVSDQCWLLDVCLYTLFIFGIWMCWPVDQHMETGLQMSLPSNGPSPLGGEKKMFLQEKATGKLGKEGGHQCRKWEIKHSLTLIQNTIKKKKPNWSVQRP